jgi:hypothetical protein
VRRHHRSFFNNEPIAAVLRAEAAGETYARALENDPHRRKVLDEREAGWQRIYLDLSVRPRALEGRRREQEK